MAPKKKDKHKDADLETLTRIAIVSAERCAFVQGMLKVS